MISSLLLSLLAPAQAGDYDDLFEAAAEEYGVPAPLLKAMAWEASRGDPTVTSAWGGYGMFDFREPGDDGPDIERIASMLEVSPDDLFDDPELQIRGAAALLAHYAVSWGGGEMPALDRLEDWAPAVAVFWGREEPALQNLYVGYLYSMLDSGFSNDRLNQTPVPVYFELMVPPPASSDYSGTDQFISASTANYSNYSRSSSDIYYIIIHTMQGSYSGSISWFQNSSSSVSAHYCVRSSDGHITQMVWEEDVGWHAGNWTYNEQSIGIEHEGYVEDPGTWYTTAMYTESAKLSADIVARTAVFGDRSHIIGHVEVPGATHTNPGTGWDWDYYMDLIGGSSGDSARVLGVVADGDIYDADARLVGATVTVDGMSTTTDSTGLWSFDGMAAGTYTITASYPGFADGSCTTNVTSGSGDWWCSIALEPGGNTEPGDGGTAPEDTGDGGGLDSSDPGGEDTGGTGGPGGPGGAGGPGPSGGAGGSQFGERLLIGELDAGGCSAAGGGAGALWLVGLLGLAARRRRG